MPAARVSSRQITEADLSSIATLLSRGFPKRKRKFWLAALEQLRSRSSPTELPKYGYVMEADDLIVGVILVISSMRRVNGRVSAYCNLSSWYVEPDYRFYAALFRLSAIESSNVTYLNISPGPHILPILEAQGFSCYCNGVFIARPTLRGLFSGIKVEVLYGSQHPKVDCDLLDQELLLEHAAYGCISLWCATSDFAYPFVFRRRLIKGLIPCAQMIYCRDVTEYVQFAGPIGRFLAMRGMPFVVIDANSPIPQLVGKFFCDRHPKYFKGPDCPRLGDIAYTEAALWGIYGSLRKAHGLNPRSRWSE
jgi:hypothetical protein